MPKFLDAPSWYDGNGNLKTIQGDLTIYVGSGYNITFDVPHVGGTNIDRFGGLGTVSSEYYLLPAASAPGRIPYYVNTNIGYQTLPSGTSGQVLTSNGNAAPSWKNLSLYLHKIHISSSDTIDVVANVYSMSSDSLTNNTIRGLITFLTQKSCNAISNCLAAAGVVRSSGKTYAAVAGIISKSSYNVNFVTYSTTDATTIDSAKLYSSTATSSATVTETIVSIS